MANSGKEELQWHLLRIERLNDFANIAKVRYQFSRDSNEKKSNTLSNHDDFIVQRLN